MFSKTTNKDEEIFPSPCERDDHCRSYNLHDHLHVSSHKIITDMLSKYGDVAPQYETIKYSQTLCKINRKGKVQTRTILLTEKALYNMKPNKLKKPQRRIAYDIIEAVTVSDNSNEFAINVPSEYDYRFESESDSEKDEFIKTLSSLYFQLRSKELRVNHIRERSTIDYTIDRRHSPSITFDERMGQLKAYYRMSMSVQSPSEIQSSFTDSTSHQSIPLYFPKEHSPDSLLICHYIRSVCAAANNAKINSLVLEYFHINFGLDHFNVLRVLSDNGHGLCLQIELLKSIKKSASEKPCFNIKKQKCLTMKAIPISQMHCKRELKQISILQKIENDDIEKNVAPFPYVNQLHLAFRTFRRLYVIYDHLGGGPLFVHLKQQKRFHEDVVRIWIAQIVHIVGYLHKQQIFNLDLTPENIWLDDKGNCYLYNIVPLHWQSPDMNSPCSVAPEYLSPDEMNFNDYDKSVDWWSLGILVYELCVGICPFYDANVNDMYRKIMEKQLLFPVSMSYDAKDLITRLLERNVPKRLGVSDRDSEDIKEHSFFRSIEWEKVNSKQIDTLFIPSEIKGHNRMTKKHDNVDDLDEFMDSISDRLKSQFSLSEDYDEDFGDIDDF